jgi:aspartyl/asparaginyl-tRNA synthetase
MIFPMFEFEAPGTFDDLRELEVELCEHLGLGVRKQFAHQPYEAMAKKYSTVELTHEHERAMLNDFGRVVFLEKFPEHTSPFWNMRRTGFEAHKIDVIIDGIETIGSAERSIDPVEMRQRFHTISEGKYAGTLFEIFGRSRVERELEDFLTLQFFPRFGGGIGMTRLIRSLKNRFTHTID